MAKRQGSNRENFDETRASILKAATEEFAEFGYSKASTDRIIQKAGVARGSLYYHFDTKENLFREVYVALLSEANDKLIAQLPSDLDAWETLLLGSRLYLKTAQNHSFRRIAIFESLIALEYPDRIEILKSGILKTLETIFGRAVSEGHFSDDVEIHELALLAYALLFEFGRQLELNKDDPDNHLPYARLFEWTLARLKNPAHALA